MGAFSSLSFPDSRGCLDPLAQGYIPCRASLVAQLVKNQPAMRETWVGSLGWEDPLEKGKATHSSILVWRIPYPWGRKESDMTEQPSLHFTVYV